MRKPTKHCFLVYFFIALPVLPQGRPANIAVNGSVSDSVSGKPVGFAVIAIPDLNVKSRTDEQGVFSLNVPEGDYRILVSASGYSPLERRVAVRAGNTIALVIQPARVTGSAVTITGERKVQNLSRNRLTNAEIKDAPATLGDSIGALATLPGVIRPGFFGPLVIRGASDVANRYFIDDIPVLNPQHFGALQSIISNDLISKIDLYSSGFPAQYGNAIGAIIDIQTVDTVKSTRSIVDVGVISSNFYHERTLINAPKDAPDQPASSANGYLIGAGRVGYLSLLVPPIYKAITGESLDALPQYYDYQVKVKTFLDDRAKHSLAFLTFGSYDTLVFLQNATEEEKEQREEEGQDPFFDQFDVRNDVVTQNQGLYYNYRPSNNFSNTVTAFASLNYIRFFSDINATAGIDERQINVRNRPDIYGLKEKFTYSYWKDRGTLSGALEYNYYRSGSRGQTQALTRPIEAGGPPDFADDTLFQTVDVDFTVGNHSLGSYLENRLELGRLTLVPGVRGDYLNRNREALVSPRGLISYNITDDLAISGSGGLYQSFPQINYFYFNQFFNVRPEVAQADYLTAEKAIHRTIGIEQKLNLWSVRVEGFRNNFFDQVVSGSTVPGQFFTNNADGRAQGVEILLRREREDGDGFYGYTSYTYTRSITDAGGDSFRTFELEQRHSFKFLAGYTRGRNLFSARYEYFSGFPYSPIIGCAQNTGSGPVLDSSCSNPDTVNGSLRYSPYYGDAYSRNFPGYGRLDIRFSRTTYYKWGTFKWYIEIINVLNSEQISNQRWRYNEPFAAGRNPVLEPPQGGLTFIPNFGLEWKF